MLIPLDEYPFHQITASFSGVGGSDPQWNDGHYLCFGDQAGTVAVLSTLRLYSNNDVLDGFVCIRHENCQYNIRVSRRLRPDMELAVGPLRLGPTRGHPKIRVARQRKMEIRRQDAHYGHWRAIQL